MKIMKIENKEDIDENENNSKNVLLNNFNNLFKKNIYSNYI